MNTGTALCTWCIGMLVIDSCHVNISYPQDQWTPERNHAIVYGPLEKKIVVIDEALDSNWRVMINDYVIQRPVTTWHGDPVCQMHLSEQMQRDQQPQTVRMAQWR